MLGTDLKGDGCSSESPLRSLIATGDGTKYRLYIFVNDLVFPIFFLFGIRRLVLRDFIFSCPLKELFYGSLRVTST
jgi:hypothetical protein